MPHIFHVHNVVYQIEQENKLLSGLFCILKLRHHTSIPLKAFELKFDKIGGFLLPKSLALALNLLNYQEIVFLSLILKKSVEPIFQSAVPILRHMAPEGTLHHTIFFKIH